MMGKLTAEAIVERALEIGDAEGLDAVTIRRLATDLGVTPMALYWHFKNKEQLITGMADHLIVGFTPTADGRPWNEQLSDLLRGLIRVLRRYPCAKDVLGQVDHASLPSFLRVWDQAVGLARQGGFDPDESCLISKYLLQSAIAIAGGVHHKDTDERLREKRIAMQSLSPEEYPYLVEMARPLSEGVPAELYDGFGVDLIIAGIVAMAGSRA
ncbi:AcrR family transcriptional regulator [Nonomuraea soli]|uniref:AcrR family transcriptional regulator n=2 Tax=Nonomuraea soli TaxID=1032476 RepID=A0A7W0HVY5_9ACTN|nr:AcrR family transcriptional regulator [Nonomuraea soli]